MDKLHNTIVDLTDEYQFDQENVCSQIQKLLSDYQKNQMYSVTHKKDLIGLTPYPISRVFLFIYDHVSLYYESDMRRVVLVSKTDVDYKLYVLTSANEIEWEKIKNENIKKTSIKNDPIVRARSYYAHIYSAIGPVILVGYLFLGLLLQHSFIRLIAIELALIFIWLMSIWIHKKWPFE